VSCSSSESREHNTLQLYPCPSPFCSLRSLSLHFTFFLHFPCLLSIPFILSPSLPSSPPLLFISFPLLGFPPLPSLPFTSLHWQSADFLPVLWCRYSRAFGGKDLKPFGLSASPSVRQVAIAPDHVGFVLCSDGVCDVAEADDVAAVVGSAWARGEDASAVLVHWAMQERQRVGIGADNVTAVVVKFEPVAPRQNGGGTSRGAKSRP
jgi:hypothetical protein